MVKKTTLAINFENGKAVASKKIALSDDIGLFILLVLETGLRLSDALTLAKNNFYKIGKDYYIQFVAKKTKKEAKRPISELLYKKVMETGSEYIFINPKTNQHYSKMWVGRNLKKAFLSECKEAKKENKTISAHSLRKSAGQKVYEINGIEAARDFLQHETYQTTKDYLNIGERKLNQLLKNTLID
jgi:integrase